MCRERARAHAQVQIHTFLTQSQFMDQKRAHLANTVAQRGTHDRTGSSSCLQNVIISNKIKTNPATGVRNPIKSNQNGEIKKSHQTATHVYIIVHTPAVDSWSYHGFGYISYRGTCVCACACGRVHVCGALRARVCACMCVCQLCVRVPLCVCACLCVRARACVMHARRTSD